MPINPDCHDGKHHACNGDAWDHEADAPASCTCSCHTENGRRLKADLQTMIDALSPG